MIPTDAELRAMIEGSVVGTTEPYAGGAESDIEAFLAGVVGRLRSSPLLEGDAEFGHYGSGYASYVDVFCYKSGGKSTTRDGDTDRIDGIIIYLSRLAPLAAYGPGHRTKTYTRGSGSSRHLQGSSSQFLAPQTAGDLPPGDWQRELGVIETTLVRAGFHFLNRHELCQRLAFDAEIATIIGPTDGGGYQVFDAIFYWED